AHDGTAGDVLYRSFHHSLQVSRLRENAQNFASVAAADQIKDLPDSFPSVDCFCHEVDYTMDTNTVRFMAIPVLGEIENVKSLSAKFAELKQRTCRARLRSFYRCEIMESTILNPLFYPNLVMADWKQATFTSHNVRTLPISPYVEIASQN